MTAAWPGWVTDRALQTGFSETPEANNKAFQPEVGPAKLRRRTSLAGRLYIVTMILSSQDWEDVQNFYSGTLIDGTQPFSMRHPRNDTAAIWQFVGGTPPKITQVFGSLDFQVELALRLLSGGKLPPKLQFNRGSNTQYIGVF